ncbi:MAG: AsmA family protein [Campylobacteraceae bacterium]|nr:AsmA family protein [Campylobacteraceae bacterium]
MFQKILLSVVLFFALSIVSFFLIIKVIDFNEYKPKIQKIMKDSTGYEIIIRGDISLSLSPVGVSISDIEISNPSYHGETPFAKLGNFDVALEIAPLFKKEIKIRHIALDNLNLLIERTKEGKFNFEMPEMKKAEAKKTIDVNNSIEKESHFPTIDVKKIRFSDANINYSDELSGNKISLEKINFNISDIQFDATKSKLQALLFKAELGIDKIKYSKYVASNVAMTLDMKDALATIESLKYTIFDSQIIGSGKVDLNGKLPRISIKHKMTDLKLTSLSRELWGSELLEGFANGDLKLAFSLGNILDIKSTLSGFIQLFAEGVVVKGYDVDKILSTFDANKKDVNGTNVITLLSSSLDSFKGGNSVLKQVNTKVDIGYSEVQLSDVALSTGKNRVAIKGALQIIDEKILDVKIGLLDAQGCSTFEQTFIGTFTKPMIKMDEKAINAIVNAVASHLGKIKVIKTPPIVITPAENCTPFYEGSIKHPQ